MRNKARPALLIWAGLTAACPARRGPMPLPIKALAMPSEVSAPADVAVMPSALGKNLANFDDLASCLHRPSMDNLPRSCAKASVVHYRMATPPKTSRSHTERKFMWTFASDNPSPSIRCVWAPQMPNGPCPWFLDGTLTKPLVLAPDTTIHPTRNGLPVVPMATLDIGTRRDVMEESNRFG